jgi:RNA polymerase primary sigma factor
MTQKTIEIKSKEQSNALNAWHKAGYCGSIIAGTGFGKSRCGVLAVAHALENGGRAIVLVPTVQLQEQFAEEFKKWGHTALLTRVEIVCYASAHKLEDNHYEIVVCDEVHLGLSPVYRKFFERNTYDKILCMTATLPEEDEYKLLLRELAPTVYTITIDECVAKGLVAPYDIYCIPVELTEVERAAYKKANNLFVQCKYRLGGFDAFNEANRILRGGPGDKGAAAQFFNSIRQRKAVVQHAENKLSLAKQIAEHHSEHKILTFSGTNEFTNMMAEELDGLVYHSGKTKKKREQTLEDFKATDGAVLCSTKALNQGFDVPDVGVGIIAGLESKSLPMIQRVGRLIRFQKGKRGRVYILYVADSQEEKWMDQATKTLHNVQRVTSLTNLF